MLNCWGSTIPPSYDEINLISTLAPFDGRSANDPIAVIDTWTHTGGMRWLVPVLLIASSSCARTENSFLVTDDNNIVQSAKLMLCGEEKQLRRRGERLTTNRIINCEGSGRIKLRYASGAEHDCLVGYVTPGLTQTFKFRATESGCA